MNIPANLFTLAGLLIMLLSCNPDSGSKVKTLSVAAFEQQLQQNPDPLIIDVRSPEEFASGHLDGAVNLNIDAPDFRAQLTRLDPNKPVFVYCKGGSRSAKAASMMQEAGINTIYELKGGMLSWENENKKTAGNAPAAKDVTSIADYKKMVADHPLLIVDFNAAWCGPCKKMKPDFEFLEQKYAGKITFAAIDVDEAKELSRVENIEGIPLVVVYKNGQELKRVMGYQTRAQLESLLQLLQ